MACWLVFAGAAFDVVDGLAARALGGGSPLGAQLDSLADMVTFGVAPGMLVYYKVVTMMTVNGVVNEWANEGVHKESPFETLARSTDTWGLVATDALLYSVVIIISVASAWRLARFNIDTRKATGFWGLPTPANAIFWTSLAFITSGPFIAYPPPSAREAIIVFEFFSRPHLLLLVSLVLGALMLSSIPLPSLKFLHYRWRGNEVIYLLLGIGAVLVVLYGMLAVPLIMVLYMLSPLWGRVFPKAI